jgi:hypothetical protein
MTDESRNGEVIEACTTNFVAQCYELYESPPLGALVKTGPEGNELYAVVYNVVTSGIEPGRRPIARGKDELNEEEIYRTSPQLFKLLKSEFSALVIGFKQDNAVYQYLPSKPARLHSFVYNCQTEEVKSYSRSLDFLNVLLKARLEIPVEELVGAVLRQMCRAYGAEKHAFLVSAGKELAALLSSDYAQLKAILKGLKYDAIQ